MTEFKVRLREAMDARHIKAIDLAEKVGVSRSQMSHYLSGYCQPKQIITYKLSVALNVSPSWLIGLDDVPMNNEDSELKETRDIIKAQIDTLDNEQLSKLLILIDTMFKK